MKKDVNIMKKIIVIMLIIISIVVISLSIVYLVNERFIKYYNNDEYDKINFLILRYFNIIESYKSYYNYGNVLYNEEKYEEAIEQYEIALEKCNDEDDECKIRINLALAKLKLIPDDLENEENIETALDILDEAKEVLTEERLC